MTKVEIEPGWLIEQFADLVLGRGSNTSSDVRIKDYIFSRYGMPSARIQLRAEFMEALERYDQLVVQKNQQYEDAWQVDGPITALVDLKDKLYRLATVGKHGAVLRWDQDKLVGTLFDILVRDIMLLAWFKLNFVDEDDDRRETDKEHR